MVKDYKEIATENESVNVPFSSKEIREWKESLNGKRGTILNVEPNRKERREKEDTRPIRNNRSKSKARKGNRLYNKMSAFYMSVTDKKLRARNYQ